MMNNKTEIYVGDYGRIMFEMMTGVSKYVPDHWKSIQAEAEPLVRQLLELNKKMSGGGYEIYGYAFSNEKVENKALSRSEKIRIAQESCQIPASELEEGDLFWHFEDQTFMEDEPLEVFEKTTKGVYYEVNNYSRRINLDEKVMLAPDCFASNYDEDKYEEQQEFMSEEYWLKKYEELKAAEGEQSLAIQVATKSFNDIKSLIQKSETVVIVS